MRAFDKTETTNFEVGIKSRLMNNKVQLNATAFSMDTDGQHYITQSPTGTGTIVGNATETAERLGFDLNVVAKLTSNLTLNMSYFTVDDGSPDILSNAAARLTPDDAYTIGLSHNFPLGNGNMFSRVDYSYDGHHMNNQPLRTYFHFQEGNYEKVQSYMHHQELALLQH